MKIALRLAISLSIAAGLLTLLMVWGEVSPADAVRSLAGLPVSVYLTALAVHAGIYLLRALRFWVLIPRALRPSYGRALMVSSAHNLASYVLPAKTGEASLIVYLRTHGGVPPSAGLASLLVARLLDGAILCALLGAACLTLGISGAYPELAWLVPLGGMLSAGTAVLLLLSWRVDLIVRGIGWAVRAFRLTRWKVGQRLVERIGSVAAALRTAGRSGKLAIAAAITVPVWLGVFGFYAVLAHPMGLPEFIGFPEATFGSSLAMLSNLLPVNGVAGFGTQETGWTLGFGALGVERDVAIATGVGVHLVQLFNVCAMGLLAHLAMGVVTKPGLRGVEVVAEEGEPS